MDKILYIVRGIPGSGKSTFAKSLGGQHYEADMYFVTPSGKYEFDPTKLRKAHEWCKDLVMMDMLKSEQLIVVSNTFTQDWELQPYFSLAEEHGYMVFSIIVENRHGGKNQHGVPEDKIEQMINRFEVKL